MIVPDETIFGANDIGEGITYGQVRRILDDKERIHFLRLRLNTFFINQTQPLQISKSAFPLTLMTCVGIETLGEIFIQEDKHDTSFQFVEIIKKVHQKFGRPMSKDFDKKLTEIWKQKDLSNIDCYGKVLYRFFRNTMIHGYQAKGVFLSYEDLNEINIDKSSGFIIMNPDWFWNQFKIAYDSLFLEVENAQPNNPLRINCLKYISEFLLE
ncbi:hypothetical protein F9K33_09750 [bacterium]|nr:MAG: hypothetical protein F9K33_09750 [bacterium]